MGAGKEEGVRITIPDPDPAETETSNGTLTSTSLKGQSRQKLKHLSAAKILILTYFIEIGIQVIERSLTQ